MLKLVAMEAAMESHTYVLRRENKRVLLREEDMWLGKVARIFQVVEETLYLTDDNNIALFPENDGHFSTITLENGGHYEVCGQSLEEKPVQQPAQQLTRFTFNRPPATAAAGCLSAQRTPATARATAAKAFQRSIFIADVVHGKLESKQTLTVRFSEFEASVEGILSKVHDALRQEETFMLTDGQGNKIIDSEGTRGSGFWKQNARKIFALKEEDYRVMQAPKRRRISRRDDTGLEQVFEKIEEVVLASQGLEQVASKIEELVQLAGCDQRTTLSLTVEQAATLKNAFACVICTNTVNEPYVSRCCHSIIGCRICVEEWMRTSTTCPKCREDDFSPHRLTGLSDAIAALGNFLRESH